MRKKLLSLLTVLCLVLGLLPTTAFAAATEAYQQGGDAIAVIITTDTEITEDVDGLVLVDAPCTVTVTDAKLSVGIVVSPDAAGATVVLAGTAEAAEVVVLAAASVKVEEAANAGAVTVDAAEAELEIAGTAEITLTENAADVTVTAAEGAAVTVDAAEGSSVAIDVAEGAEVSVTVAEGAAATVTTAEGAVVALDVAEGATVSIDVAEGADVTITAADPDAVEVTGDGAASAVINGETAADAEEEEEEDAEEEEDKDEDTGFVTEVIPPVTETVETPRIVWAPLHDQNNTEGKEDTVLNGALKGSAPAVSNAQDLGNGVVRADVTLSADGLQKHTAAESAGQGYWIGFGLPVSADNSNEYNVYVLKKDAVTTANPTWTCVSFDDYFTVGEDWFGSIYLGGSLGYDEATYNTAVENDTKTTTDEEGNEVTTLPETVEVEATKGTEYVVVITTAKTSDEAAEIATPDDMPDIANAKEGEEIVYIFDVTIDATLEVEVPAE